MSEPNPNQYQPQVPPQAGPTYDFGNAAPPRYAQQPVQPRYAQQPQYVPEPVADSGSFGWAILGFFIPLVGLILWLVWKDEKPKCAKMAGVGALVSVVISILCAIVMTVFGGLFLGGIAGGLG